MHHKILLTLTALVATLIYCLQAQSSLLQRLKIHIPRLKKTAPLEQPMNQQPTITVWIHGTGNIPPLSLLHSCPPGLCLASTLPDSYHLKKIAQRLSNHDRDRFAMDSFYLFGWSGKLSFKERELAARDLYASLTQELARYEDVHGTQPRTRVITHSHGGNVALNLAKVQDAHTAPLVIDELILLCCPVQKETAPFTHSSLFKTIYSLYSDADVLQILDPQGIYPHKSPEHEQRRPLFSQRRFTEQENMTQARVKINGRAPFHMEFVLSTFIRSLPSVMNELAQHHVNEKKSDKPLTIHIKA